MINSRDINELTPKVQLICYEWLKRCAQQGVSVQVICTYRDHEYQNYLYEQGRSRRGRIVTNARGGQSAHNHRIAWDFCIVKNGVADWNDIQSYTKAGNIAKDMGLVWGGDWKIRDYGHIEYKENEKMQNDNGLLGSAKQSINKAIEPVATPIKKTVSETVPAPIQNGVKYIWRSRLFWSAVASAVTVVNPMIGQVILNVSKILLGG